MHTPRPAARRVKRLIARLVLRVVPIILRRPVLRQVVWSVLRRLPRVEAAVRGLLARDISWVSDRGNQLYTVSDLSLREREIYLRLRAGLERRAEEESDL